MFCALYAGLKLNLYHELRLFFVYILYIRKYWRSLNLAVWPKTTFLTSLVDLNLAVWYGIAIRTCTRKKNLADFNLAVLTHTCTAKPPNLIPLQIFRLYGIHKTNTENRVAKIIRCMLVTSYIINEVSC